MRPNRLRIAVLLCWLCAVSIIPPCASEPVYLEVREGLPTGTSVGFIRVQSGFTYRFNDQPKEFELNATSGEITTAVVLDRESLQNDRIDLVVLSSQPTYPIEVRIVVIDVNDNSPQFPEPSLAVQLSESSAINKKIFLTTATDRDIGSNGITSKYRIVRGNEDGKFDLRTSNDPNTDTVVFLYLETVATLDREQKELYTLNISAEDGGSPPLHGYLVVNITVLDTNDNPPIFDHSAYSVSINESAPAGHRVLQVHASDADTGDNARITYSIAESNAKQPNQFCIDQHTGVISTNFDNIVCNSARVSGESGSTANKSCVLTVYARDNGSPRQDGRTYVTVNLVDTNDHDPQITFRVFGEASVTVATVDENAERNQVVAAISVVDGDDGLNGETELVLSAGNEMKHFRLDNEQTFYSVRVDGVLDREKVPCYNLTFVASDRGTPSRSTTKFLIIHVNDINDHEPQFERSEYSVVLSETVNVGSYVVAVSATDADTGVNALVFYGIESGNDKHWFTVDRKTGLVTTVEHLNREEQDLVELKIYAHDGGPNRKFAYSTLKIHIQDENDEAPTFAVNDLNVTLSENSPPHTLVAIVTATDSDLGPNGTVNYAFQSSVKLLYGETFEIDPIYGRITTAAALDREKCAFYQLTVIAKDNGQPSLSSALKITVHVADINDNKPILYPSIYFHQVRSGIKPWAFSAKVLASDADEGANAKIVFSIVNGAEDRFRINDATGEIQNTKVLESRQQARYEITVSAVNSEPLEVIPGARAVSNAASTAMVVVFVRDASFRESHVERNYSFRISESSDTHRRELGALKKLEGAKYSIVNGDPFGYFIIDPLQAVIYTTGVPIDRERLPSTNLTVVANTLYNFTTYTVAVEITDIDDNAPTFDRPYVTVRIPESFAIGLDVFVPQASDLDDGPNAQILYSIEEPEDLFFIDERGGVVRLKRSLRGQQAGRSIPIKITARNPSGDLNATQLLLVEIEDVNDHTPFFDHASYEISLPELTPVNERFFSLYAADDDGDENGRVSYSITEGNAEQKFGIFPDGQMYIKEPLDHEHHDFYVLVITARDNGARPRSSSVPLTIHIIDDNDNAPRFVPSGDLVFSITENQEPDSFVGILVAEDADSGRNAELSYSLSSDQTDFSVDPKSGVIRTLKSFDREKLVETTTHDYITVEAAVADNGNPRLKSESRIVVYVLDENDNPPVFSRKVYRSAVSESTPANTQVARVSASDPDDGANGMIIYTIPDSDVVSIDSVTGQITLTKPLDRETVGEYSLTVIASDAAPISLRRSASATLNLIVLDENDNAPVFDPTTLESKEIAEDTEIGTEIYRFSAQDMDLGLNGEVSYSISAGNIKEAFKIDAITGVLRVNKALDFEQKSSYVLNITAADGGSPSVSTSISFNVKLTDVNDNAPVFPNGAIVRTLKEGVTPDTLVATAVATDRDQKQNSKISYSLTAQIPHTEPYHFHIKQETGQIYTAREIDRELTDTYKLTITATDHGEPSLTSEKAMTLVIEDVNDNAPSFISVSTAVLPIPANRSHSIMAVTATDPDAGTNGQVSYELVQGNHHLFDLDRMTGEILLKQNLLPTSQLDVSYHLKIRASDEAPISQRRSSETNIVIITSAGESPDILFEKSHYSGSIGENEPAGTSVLSVRAVGKADSELEYYVTAVSAANSPQGRKFVVDIKTGVIETAMPLDREQQPEPYEVVIYATDRKAKPPSTAKTKAIIRVLDRNDTPPKFTAVQYAIRISEDAPTSTTILTVHAEDPDLQGSVKYELVPQKNRPVAQGFQIDLMRGHIVLVEQLDREVASHHELIVRVSDGVQSCETSVDVTVIDTNDNSPVFSRNMFSFDIPEDTPRGHQIGTVRATDADIGQNGQVSYSVLSDWGNDLFSLNPQTGVFTLTSNLDYEQFQHYIFVVSAQDAGVPNLSSTVTVYMNVIDLNDNSPVFDPLSYNAEVSEDAPLNTTVLTVHASDLDSGSNGEISYTILEGDEDHHFEISKTGTITTRRSLDRETRAHYNLVVCAEDRAANPRQRLSSTAQVAIVIRDVNDITPHFISPNTSSIVENAPLNTIIMAVKAVDDDEGRNSHIEYTFASRSESHFSIGPVDGLLRVNGELDRELKSEYQIIVVAKDRGKIPLSATTTIVVHVLDENDNNPVFEQRQYEAVISENSPVEMSVLRVHATDLDVGPSGLLRYSIIAGDSNHDFSIDEETGVIRVHKQVDYERKNRYVITVQAEDSSTDARYDTCMISISLKDINDNPPTFLDNPYEASIVENAIIPAGGGLLITQMQAVDVDADSNRNIYYRLHDGDKTLFRVNSSNGNIYALKSLDREQQSEYTATILAIDSGTPSLTGTGTLILSISDINDNAPVFEKSFYEVHVAENSPIGTFVAKISATDSDQGLNALLRYTFEEASDWFHLDPETGVLLAQQSFDREEQASFDLRVRCSDSGLAVKMSTVVAVRVLIDDVNDNAPEFLRSIYSIKVDEAGVEGSFVFGEQAQDADVGSNSQMEYSLSGPDVEFFDVDSATGVVKQRTPTITNRQAPYELRLIATDKGQPPMSSNVTLRVRAERHLEFPEIQETKQQFALPEDTPVGLFLTAVRAKSSLYSTFNYRIAGGNLGQAFGINSSTGAVFVANALDYETVKKYSLWIQAENVNSKLSAATELSIRVQDVNDNVPQCSRAVFNVTVMEEQSPPEYVARVSATDADEGTNGEVFYQFESVAETSLFSIEPDTGVVSTRSKLDRETMSRYRLIVQAVDRGYPANTGTCTVFVDVADKNDNSPRFTRLFSANVSEDATVGTFVIQMTSIDSDVGQNAVATYSLNDNPGGKFAIDPVSGNVTVVGNLDREAKDEYNLKVSVFDGAWKKDTPLTITVTDVNDNSPVFDKAEYAFYFTEQQPTQSFVGRVQAVDRDKEGRNSRITYFLKRPSELFHVDSITGNITTKRTFTYRKSRKGISPENNHALRIVATDYGKPVLTGETTVTVHIMDKNSNAPVFAEKSYFVPVPESTTLGTSLVQVSATSEDERLDAEVQFRVAGGNGTDLIQLDAYTGWITLAKSVRDRIGDAFEVSVSASESRAPLKKSFVVVTIRVTQENKHPPAFSSASYQISVAENEPVGNELLTIQASDADEGVNGQFTFALEENENFVIDRNSGVVKLNSSLDFETAQGYSLKVMVRDLAFNSFTTEVTLTVVVTDVNDCAPRFSKDEFQAYIFENEPVDTEITKLEATDEDSPRNRIIRYSLLGPQARLFAIDDVSGVLVSRAVFDFEQQGTFDLEVVASNPGTVQFTSAKVKVHVLGRNEFYPKFTQRIFEFQASESDPVGKFVGNITAVDEDAGEDGVVLYFLVGANNERGFKVDARTGTISVARKPDRENEARVVLTAIAKNRGSIRGNDTDEAQVVILIQDGNDPPVFSKSLYEVKVSEDVEPYHYVVTVSATDRDVRPSNNQFVYAILDGNINRAFTIDPNTGDLQTALTLDRETVSQYNLTVGAIDNGIPSQTGQTTVLVTIADVNDNAPYFEDGEVVGYVAENEPPYTSVMVLSARDRDAPPNTGPFAYFLVGGAHKNKFELDQHSGVLRTVESLDRESIPELSLVVEVRDNGAPMHKSRTTITIRVTDTNDNPSSPRNVTVIVWTLNGVFPGGKIADVPPSDVDTVGDFNCRIQSGDMTFFTMGRHCALQSRRSEHPGNYALVIRGNDGRHQEVQSTVGVQFRSFDNSTLKHSVTVMWPNSTADEFVSLYYEDFVDSVSQASSYMGALVAFSISESQGSVQISVAVQKRPGVYASSSEVKHALQKSFLNPGFVVGYEPCDSKPCLNGASCQSELEQSGNFRFSSSESLIITSPAVVRVAQCTCLPGYFGDRCESQRNPCSPNPCSSEATCHPDQKNGFYCSCPPHLLGRLCELQNTDSCTAFPCRNGGSCENSPSGGFFCLCKPGFKGTFCEHRSDSCRPNRCLNGGVCFADKTAYHCECKANYHGKHCEKTTYGFHPYSYMEFPSLRSSTNDISIVFATSKRNALLAYNYGSQSGGRSDFISLELVEGKPKFSFGGSRTAISSISLNSVVADGQWHKVTVFRNGKTASLSVVDCVRYGEVCEECSHSNSTCSASVLGHSGTLGFNNNPLYIGGLPCVEAILERPSQLSSDDFVGCVHSVTINGKSLDLESPLRSQFVTDMCPRDSDVCASKCGGGECIDEWFSSSCVCPNGMIAPDCQLESSSVFAITGEAFLELVPKEKQRRTILQHQISRSLSHDMRNSVEPEPVKSMAFSFRTKSMNGLLMLSTTEADFTKLELSNGRLTYHSQFKGDRMISVDLETPCADGQWHTVTLIRYHEPKPWVSMTLDERTVDIRLAPEAHGVHDFIDPFLTNMWLGGYAPGRHNAIVGSTPTFIGCIQGISVNREVQSMNSTRPTYFEVTARGEILNGCSEHTMGAAFGARYPLNIGIVVVIVFFATLICGLFASYTFFKQCKSVEGSQKSEHKISNTYVSPSSSARENNNQESGAQEVVTSTPSRPENTGLQPKKQRSLWPPTTEASGGLNSFQELETRDKTEHRDVYQSRLPAYNIQTGSEAPECYDFENASSIAPSDIDIVYHYKAYRDGAVRDRKNKPPLPYQNRLSPAGANISNLQSRTQLPHNVLAHRLSPLGNPIRSSPSHVLLNTPLARLSPSSEVSQPLPRILTLQDISGKPIQNALLATSSKNLDPMAISDRSLGSPVSSSHLASSSKDMDTPALQSGKLAAAASAQLSKLKGTPTAEIDLGLTQDEIERLDFRRSSSLVRALDAVASDTDDDVNGGRSHGVDDDDRRTVEHDVETNTDGRDDDSSADESENESFTCSEFEFGHNYEKIKSPARPRKQPTSNRSSQNEAYALKQLADKTYNAYEVPPPGPPGAPLNWNLMNSWAHQRPVVVKAAPRAIHSRQNSRDSNLSQHSAASRSIHSRQNSRDSCARVSLHGSMHNIVSHSRQHSRDSAYSQPATHHQTASNNTNEEYV